LCVEDAFLFNGDDDHCVAHRSCPLFIKKNAALSIRAEENVNLADAMVKIDEIQHH